MEQLVAFTLAGAGLYLFTDWLVNRIERARGAALTNRPIVFFAIILVLAVVSFEIIGRLLRG